MNKIHLFDKILSPLVTEKSTNLSEQNKIVFRVPFNCLLYTSDAADES